MFSTVKLMSNGHEEVEIHADSLLHLLFLSSSADWCIWFSISTLFELLVIVFS